MKTCGDLEKYIRENGLKLEAGYKGRSWWAHLESETVAYVGKAKTLQGAIADAVKKSRGGR